MIRSSLSKTFLGLGTAAGLLTLLLASGSASAHAFPKKSEPAAGATIARSPSEAKIWFTSYLEPLFNQLVVKNADGHVVSQGKARVDQDNRALLEVKLPPLKPGTYQVNWRVTAKDGHQTHGHYTFTVKSH